MSQLKAGFARIDVTPRMGVGISGYFIPRYADGVLDPLEINAIALECGDARIVLLAIDNCVPTTETMNKIRDSVAEANGLDRVGVFVSATHTHTSPYMDITSEDALVREYTDMILWKAADVAGFALADLTPAQMGYARSKAPNIAFVRRFRMKDGSIRTNPGIHNPEIDHPIGRVDEEVNVLRFDREGKESVILVNFGNHPDTVGGCKISADWPGFMRRSLEAAIPDAKAVFFNGALGDVAHVNVFPSGGDLNDMFVDFDDVTRGYGHTRHMGRVVAGAVLQVYDKVHYVPVDSIRYAETIVQVPSNMPSPEDMPLAKQYNDLHLAGRDEEIPYRGMELTTVVAEAGRMVKLEHGPAYFPMLLSSVAIGPVALLGIPGEPFTDIGIATKQTDAWDMVLPCSITNGYEGYFPMMDNYNEGGYEARSSRFKSGVGELIIREGKTLLDSLYN